ncbi:FAD-binding oxidoreductase [Shimia sp. R9_1]|uniref:FAD-binding oxidoreductase n=1 Tax=Shimia sp. R9_1 TaxID=2821111 RepID=UPI001ADBDD46|nr:FAD-binding oxidoreductase [Shimia sp. R9_1]MBO9409311.1 FAD-binding oxidoreductase [Shimia sp. R9_1]
MIKTQTLSGWGRWPQRKCATAPLDPAGFDALPVAAGKGMIARGFGRSYGDIAMNPDLTLLGTARNRILSFDEDTGTLVAEAGLSLTEILDVFVPRGWFPAVTPGTKFVSLAGLIAVDAHGKNHHKVGSFGDHVLWFDLYCADGQIRRCSPEENTALFHATIGGNGLTGHILTVCTKLLSIPSGWVRQTTHVAENLADAIEIFETHNDVTYSVAWIDCLAKGAHRGRSLVFLGEHAAPEELAAAQRDLPFDIPLRKKQRMPMDAPSWALNTYTIRAFNRLYHKKNSQNLAPQLVDYDRYFYPLDAILEWNRLYGRGGFAQYQCALPLAESEAGLTKLLTAISDAGLGSFLAVLKRFGPGAPQRPLSFPMEGYTLALDFQLSPRALTLMTALDEITTEHGGRLYMAKDSRMSQPMLEAGYAEGLPAFRDLRAQSGARGLFQSMQSQRLNL